MLTQKKTSNQLVPKQFGGASNNGLVHSHNFSDRYVDDSSLQKPSKDVAKEIAKFTKSKISTIIGVKTESSHNKFAETLRRDQAHFIKYTPNSNPNQPLVEGAPQRIIQMHETQKDPLQPAQFKHKRIPQGPGSPPPTILHSPTRKLTAKDQLDWKIPPCISNWKNAKGYTIPIEMRLSADGRTLQNHTVNEKFAQLADVYYLTERQARKEIEERNRLQKTLAYKEKLQKEEQMRDAASKAREEKNRLLLESSQDTRGEVSQQLTELEVEEKGERDKIRYMRKREIEREKRIDDLGSKKSKVIRDEERDITEKIALGQAQPTQNELMFDQRLFNQNAGLDTGFGSDEEYNVYDKPLFNDKTAASIYKSKGENPDEESKENDEVHKALTKEPTRGFDGVEKKNTARTKPVEFEKHNDDLFGMDAFLGDRTGKKLKK